MVRWRFDGAIVCEHCERASMMMVLCDQCDRVSCTEADPDVAGNHRAQPCAHCTGFWEPV